MAQITVAKSFVQTNLDKQISANKDGADHPWPGVGIPIVQRLIDPGVLISPRIESVIISSA